MSGLNEFPYCRNHSVSTRHIELDTDLRYGSLWRPSVGAEAGLSSLGKGPDPDIGRFIGGPGHRDISCRRAGGRFPVRGKD
jgi:hypothetical protein